MWKEEQVGENLLVVTNDTGRFVTVIEDTPFFPDVKYTVTTDEGVVICQTDDETPVQNAIMEFLHTHT